MRTSIELGPHSLSLDRPADPEALIDEAEFESSDEFLPYWAELWPSGLALASFTLTSERVAGARVCELGCGLGLPSLAACLAGARSVLASDWSADAVALLSANATLNGLSLETAVVGWSSPAALVARGPFDLVLCADVLYESRNAPLLADLIPRLLAPGGAAWIADPSRTIAQPFLADLPLLAQDGRVTIHSMEIT